jgi:putative MATE family efflux protein
MARDLTRGSIPAHIFALAIPALLSMFAIVVNNFVDTALVGHLGDKELAAVGSAGFVIWIIFSIMDIFSVGTVAIISRDFGAKRLDEASEKSKHIIRFTLLFSIILAAIGILFSGEIFRLLNLEPEVERMGRIYLMIVFLSVPPLFLGEVAGSIFRSIGDTTTPMIVMLVTVGINIVLDIFLIYGIWIFPRLETMGAAIATSIAHTLGAVLGLIFVLRGKIPFKIIPSNLNLLDFRVIRSLFKIGLPISIAYINFSFVYLALTRIMSEFGTSAVAAIPVGNRAESLSYMTCFGFYMAASSMVGQNLGAGKPERASKAAWTSVGAVSILTFIFGLIFFFFSREITSILTNEHEVIEVASSYLEILALSQVFMGFEFVLEGAFAGSGHTLPPTLVSIPGTVIRIPLAYYLAIPLGMGPNGIFWAITFSTIIKGIILLLWFRTGSWMK